MLRLLVGSATGEGIVFLFSIPIAMLAAEFGLAAGVAASLGAMVLTVVWTGVQQVDLGALGYLTRGSTFLAIGALVGYFTAVRNRERDLLIRRLDELANTDALTGLMNRRAWEKALEQTLSRSRRAGSRFAIAAIDLDHFKILNDRHGHETGDRVLREAAAAWLEVLRGGDFIARAGGEEFLVLLNIYEKGPGGLVTACDRLRTATPGGVTCSIGVAEWDGNEGGLELAARADASLYRAKRLGRDRVVLAEPPQEGRSPRSRAGA